MKFNLLCDEQAWLRMQIRIAVKMLIPDTVTHWSKMIKSGSAEPKTGNNYQFWKKRIGWLPKGGPRADCEEAGSG